MYFAVKSMNNPVFASSQNCVFFKKISIFSKNYPVFGQKTPTSQFGYISKTGFQGSFLIAYCSFATITAPYSEPLPSHTINLKIYAGTNIGAHSGTHAGTYRCFKNSAITRKTYTYDMRNRLDVETKRANGEEEIIRYIHDFNGNQTKRFWEKFTPGSNAPGRVSFNTGKFGNGVVVLEKRSYNGFGELVNLYRDTLETTYTYQPNGLRLRKQFADGSSTSHIWDGAQIIAEFGNNGNVFARYLRGIGLVARDIGGNLEYYLFNGHNDVIERTSANGTTLKRYDYDAFGVERGLEEMDNNPFRYCSEYFDREAETYYLRNRDYAPSTGRFTQEDPAFDGLNWYTYANNNPVRYADPSGLSATRPGDIIADVSHILNASSSRTVAGSSPVFLPDSLGAWTWEQHVASPIRRFGDVVSGVSSIVAGAAFGAPDVVSRELAILKRAMSNSTIFEISLGVGYGDRFSLGPVRGEWLAAGRQTISLNFGTGEYRQRDHVSGELGVDILRDILGIRAQISHGYTYSSIDGYIIEDGRAIPATEARAGAYAGSAFAGWGTDWRDSDTTIAFGLGRYRIVGGDFEFIFNITEFRRQMGWS